MMFLGPIAVDLTVAHRIEGPFHADGADIDMCAMITAVRNNATMACQSCASCISCIGVSSGRQDRNRRR